MVRRLVILTVLAAIIAAAEQFAIAYELRTHAELTMRAYSSSTSLGSYLRSIALSNDQLLVPDTVTPRSQLAGFRNTGTARDWMVEGAIREDDYIDYLVPAIAGCTRPENPATKVSRLLNHFFDVQRGGRGLSVLMLSGIPAPDWALGRQGRGPGPKENQYTLPDTREYQYRSLMDPSKSERERYTALLFRTLGHVLHLVEDMAQPQHTRNDPHGGCFEILTGEQSWYERYLENRVLGQPFRQRAETTRPIVFDGYEPVAARTYDAFFTDENRRGMADFSSRNFLTAGTNLGSGRCSGLPEPSCEPTTYVPELRSFSIQTLKGPVSGIVTLFTRPVADRYTGTVIHDVPLSSRSLWDQHLELQGAGQKFTLNTINYDAMADLLLPRAVGYAAGVLDIFFRGQVNAWILPSVSETAFARIRIANPVPAGGRPGERMAGTLELYYDAVDGNRWPLASWSGVELGPGEQRELTLVNPPSEPPPSEPGRYLMVFRGQLGAEPDAIAATWVDGRVWTLALQREAYDADFTLTAPPGPPVTYPQGPTLSVQLDASDSRYAWSADDGSAYYAGVESVESRGQIHLYTCQGPDYAPSLLGITRYGDYARYSMLHRGKSVPWGGPARLSVTGSGVGFDERRTPVSIEVVRLAPPSTVEDLQRYSHLNPPVVEAVLATFVINSESPVEVGTVDLGDATFIGVRVSPEPQYPSYAPDTGRNGYLDRQCFRSLLDFGQLSFVGAAPAWSHSVGRVELRIPLAP